MHERTNRHSFLNHILEINIPQTVKESRSSAEKDEWMNLMQLEILSLRKNPTWTSADLPTGNKAIG